MKEFTEIFSVELCRANPTKLYIFGDNLVGYGKGGQAIIRDEPNTFGIPTKRLPTMEADAFFSDQADEFRAVRNAVVEIMFLAGSYDAVVFPTAGLGTGLARMQECSPKLFDYMNHCILQFIL